MGKEYKLDKVDQQILEHLLEDSRRTYQEIAKDIIVSPGTVHVRINKMKEAGIITGSKVTLDHSKLGLEVCAFVGINLVSAKDYQTVLRALEKFDEIVEIHYTTGNYSLFVKVMTKNTKELHNFLVEKLQFVLGVRSTETLISLDNPILRESQIPLEG